jgi:hypothetical protein
MYKWTKEKPVRAGYYWISDDPETERVQVVHYKPGEFGVMTVCMRANPDLYFAGPIPEPKIGGRR